ncbi:unnamed protein product [Prunus armeniaca]
MNPYEDDLFCDYCNAFSCSDPQQLLQHVINRHEHAREAQGVKAADNRKRCTLCVSSNGHQNSKSFTNKKALESHMDSVHPGWKAAYPNCQKKNCHRVFLNQQEYEFHKPTCGKN